MQRIEANPQLDDDIKSQTGDSGETPTNPDEEAFTSLRTRYLEEQLANNTQNRSQRKNFAQKIYYLTLVWLCCIFVILFLQGSTINFNLSDKVLITLLAGSSINIIGLMATVIKYLFNSGNLGR